MFVGLISPANEEEDLDGVGHPGPREMLTANMQNHTVIRRRRKRSGRGLGVAVIDGFVHILIRSFAVIGDFVPVTEPVNTIVGRRATGLPRDVAAV